jgi:NTP pyrophosphatase (non-canonical NTP hydrolase)
MDYNKLAIQAHEDAKANGWYEDKKDIEDLKILILSEAFEAFEAYRKAKYTTLTETGLNIELTYLGHYNAGLLELETLSKEKTITLFTQQIKDTFEDEIADVAIRALDLAGYLSMDFSLVFIEPIEVVFATKEDFPSILRELTSRIHRLFNRDVDALDVLSIMRWCELCAKVYQFDLEQHIALKMAYNKTRGHKHGGKVL